jgi:hypothetical protein
MPVKNTFGEDRSAMVDAIFAEQDRRLVERMRANAVRQATKKELRQVSGIRDDGLLDKLIDLEITPGTFTALAMIPLIEVAWADGKMDPPEKEAILKAADEHGIKTGTDEHDLLEGWLEKSPGEQMLTTWTQYIRDITSTLEPEQKANLKRELLDGARRIAESAGGFLGLTSKISRPEQAMLDRLAEAF